MKIEPLNNDHRFDLGITLGLAAAINALRGQSNTFEKLPGYNTAIAVIEAIEAQQRAFVAGANFRAAAAVGVDISTHMIGLRGRGEIYAEPMDLEQLAEFSASVDTHPKDGDVKQGPLVSGAVAKPDAPTGAA